MENYKYQRRVVCAANRCPETGDIVLGARHFDLRMVQQIQAYKKDQLDDVNRFTEQGFIDQHGTFMCRQEAWKVAKAANQIIRRVGSDTANGGTLFSENLY